MPRPLSDDLRQRLVAAVDVGLLRRSAAERFGVAASTAIHWVALATDGQRATSAAGRRLPLASDRGAHR